MAYKVEVIFHKCGKDFDHENNEVLPFNEEIGYVRDAICTKCGANNGKISVSLVIE